MKTKQIRTKSKKPVKKPFQSAKLAAFSDHTTTLQDLKKMIQDFCEAREWDQFHTPRDLAIGLVGEAAELVTVFRFCNEEDIQQLLSDPDQRRRLTDEMADVLFFLLRFAQLYNIDLAEAFRVKMGTNNQRYPVEKARGSKRKYTELR